MKLSVIIPCFKFKEYIRECVDSVLMQITSFDFEILIRDDNSLDGTSEILKELYGKNTKVNILDGSENIGALNSVLKLLNYSNGEYICYIDGDDYLTDINYFERAIKYLDKNKEYNIYSGGYKYKSGNDIYPPDCWMTSPIKTVTIRDLLQENYISFCRIFRKLKNVDKQLFGNMYPDWILNFECLKNDKIAYCETDRYIGIYRIHENSMFSKKTNEEKQVMNDLIRSELTSRYELYKKDEINLRNIIVHIHLFLNKPNLEEIAYKNIKFIKENGFKVMVTSPKILPEIFYEFVDIFYHDKENQLLQEKYTDIEIMYHWSRTDSFCLNFGVKEVQKHGLAVLRSMIKGCQIAKLNDIKYILRIEFDDLLGINSIKKIKEQFNSILENNCDFSLIRNVYSYYTDISVHLMIYNCNKFLSVFGSIKNENDYNLELKNLGIPRKSTMLETFIYLMIEHYKLLNNLKINYLDTSASFTDYSDTQFNVHQNCFSLKDGLLSDVTYVYKNSSMENRLCVASRNFSSIENIKITFDLINQNSELSSIIMYSGGINCWNINFIDDISNIEYICIKHNDNDYHRKYKIIKLNDTSSFKLHNITDDDDCLSKIELF